MGEPDDLPDGPLAMALSLVQSTRDPTTGIKDLEELVDLGVQVWGTEGLVRGFGCLIYIGVNLAKRRSTLGPVLQTMVPAIMQQLANDQERLGIPREVLPIASGLLTAAYFDQMPNEWRAKLGSPIPGDSLIFYLTACLVVQFVDAYVYGQPGQFADVMDLAFAADPT